MNNVCRTITVSNKNKSEFTRQVNEFTEKVENECEEYGYTLAEFDIDYKPTSNMFGVVTHNAIISILCKGE